MAMKGLHALLQALPSSHTAPLALTGLEHVPVAGSQVPALWHESLAELALAGLEHVPVALSQVPALWHWSGAEQVTGLVPAQAPFWQESLWVQASPSLQAEPLALAGLEHVPVAVSQVPALWHWSEALQV